MAFLLVAQVVLARQTPRPAMLVGLAATVERQAMAAVAVVQVVHKAQAQQAVSTMV